MIDKSTFAPLTWDENPRKRKKNGKELLVVGTVEWKPADDVSSSLK